MRTFKFVAATFLLLQMLTTCALADTPATVVYDGATHELTMEQSPEVGLFADAQELMPGDTIMQHVQLQTKHLEKTVSFYFQGICDSHQDFLKNEMHLVCNNSRGERLAEIRGSQWDTPVLLKKFTGNEFENIVFTLQIDTSAGNELQDLNGRMEWVFTVQEDTVTPPKPPVPPGPPPLPPDPPAPPEPISPEIPDPELPDPELPPVGPEPPEPPADPGETDSGGEPGGEVSPKTGDDLWMLISGVGMIVFATAILVILVARKKKEK